MSDQVNDQKYMQEALSLAQKGKGFTSPNPAVGAVVVKNNNIVGKGWHKGAGLAHAEVEAINDAGVDAEQSTLYVTLEPCNHHGKTPPCTEKIINAGISRVVIGCKDPNPNVSGNGILRLQENKINVDINILKKEAEILIEDFAWYTCNDKKPFVTLKCASTIDGRIATSIGDSKWITNEKSREHVHKLRHENDAILIGAGTLKADNPSLTARINNFDSKDPARIILDPYLSVDRAAKVLTQESNAPTILVTSKDASTSKKESLKKTGVTIIEVPLENEKFNLAFLLHEVGQMDIVSLLVEGGSNVINSFLKEKLVNKALFFIAPKIYGGSDGIPICSGTGPKLMKEAINLVNINVSRFEEDTLIQGYIKQDED
ncbi:MAG: bifunctional diaminohydroxyphosphoribosylaminopyrimidine deaminase/5-amino-6-(5-phosphoribosylamino)uracil reductase RibD [Desulfobacteraceae bacterium]|nr:bifunctional diaminohydroxyphosphoribosylaminopyrimidine deaminase/5-amino-6-(5-phosphoribosylamino)uracil reductase RibD [Desulfobacteraceae bacterium]